MTFIQRPNFTRPPNPSLPHWDYGVRKMLGPVWHGGGLDSTTLYNTGNTLANAGTNIQFDGTLGSGPVITGGKFGRCLKFGGTANDYVNISNTVTVLQGIALYSLSAWFYPTANSGTIWGEANGAGNLTYAVYVTAGGVIEWDLHHGSFSSAIGTRTVTLGAWHHVVAVLSSSFGMRLYLDGSLEATNANTAPGTQGNGKADIGAYYQTGTRTLPFTGLIDMVAIWTRILEASEVQSLYQFPMSIFGPSPRRKFFIPSVSGQLARSQGWSF